MRVRKTTKQGASTVQVSQGRPRPTSVKPKDLPAGTPAKPGPRADRDSGGRFLPGPATRAAAAKGAAAVKELRRLGRLLGLSTLPDDHPFLPYAKLSRQFRDEHMARLAASVGGGEVGPGPASIVSSAALQMAASRWLSDEGARTRDAKLLLDASKLMNDSRQNLLAAHHLCAKEAESRPDTHRLPWEDA